VCIASNLVGNEADDREVIYFLAHAAMDFETAVLKNSLLDVEGNEEKKETSVVNGLIMQGINTTYGMAAHNLTLIQDRRYSDVVFSTVEAVLKKGHHERRTD